MNILSGAQLSSVAKNMLWSAALKEKRLTEPQQQQKLVQII